MFLESIATHFILKVNKCHNLAAQGILLFSSRAYNIVPLPRKLGEVLTLCG